MQRWVGNPPSRLPRTESVASPGSHRPRESSASASCLLDYAIKVGASESLGAKPSWILSKGFCRSQHENSAWGQAVGQSREKPVLEAGGEVDCNIAQQYQVEPLQAREVVLQTVSG